MGQNVRNGKSVFSSNPTEVSARLLIGFSTVALSAPTDMCPPAQGELQHTHNAKVKTPVVEFDPTVNQ